MCRGEMWELGVLSLVVQSAQLYIWQTGHLGGFYLNSSPLLYVSNSTQLDGSHGVYSTLEVEARLSNVGGRY
jgi:hypothetical protein